MQNRLTCTITGSVIDEQATTTRHFYVCCGACGWNQNRLQVEMFADAEQELREHYDADHGVTPEFVWSERMGSLEWSEAARAINAALSSLDLPTVSFRAPSPTEVTERGRAVEVRRNLHGQATVWVPPLRGCTIAEALTNMSDGAVEATMGVQGRPAEVVIRNAIDRELQRAYLIPKAAAS